MARSARCGAQGIHGRVQLGMQHRHLPPAVSTAHGAARSLSSLAPRLTRCQSPRHLLRGAAQPRASCPWHAGCQTAGPRPERTPASGCTPTPASRRGSPVTGAEGRGSGIAGPTVQVGYRHTDASSLQAPLAQCMPWMQRGLGRWSSMGFASLLAQEGKGSLPRAAAMRPSHLKVGDVPCLGVGASADDAHPAQHQQGRRER